MTPKQIREQANGPWEMPRYEARSSRKVYFLSDQDRLDYLRARLVEDRRLHGGQVKLLAILPVHMPPWGPPVPAAGGCRRFQPLGVTGITEDGDVWVLAYDCEKRNDDGDPANSWYRYPLQPTDRSPK